MTEPNASPVQNVSNSVLPQPTLAAGISDDDDEPPSSSGVLQHLSQVTTRQSSPDLNHISLSQRDSSESRATFGTPPAGAPLAVDSRWSVVKQRMRILFTPVHPLGPEPTYLASFKAAATYTPLNLCLLFIPVSWALHYTHQSDTLVFVFSALGIIPLAALLGFGTEQIALKTSMSVGGLLNATLGNIVEMIIAGIALSKVNIRYSREMTFLWFCSAIWS